MNKRLSSKAVHHVYQNTEASEQLSQKDNGCYQSFEETLRSLAEKSPKSHLNNRNNQPKAKQLNNFKGILEAQ